MTAMIITGIGELVTNDPALGKTALGLVLDAAVIVEDGRIVWVGAANRAPETDESLDVGGRAVIPGFVDSHAHLVFAGDRSAEFDARMTGQRYTAGGIRTTVAATRAASDDVLSARLTRLVTEARSQGTTTIETKSGYGLTIADEKRSLEIGAALADETTYLGAHVVPEEYVHSPDAYVDLVCTEMLDACAGSARWIDVFCERGAFDEAASRRILEAGIARGLGARIHANQLGPGPGAQIAVEVGAASADHCTHLAGTDVDALAGSSTVATLLPGAEFSTRSPYPDARRLLDAGATVALATDCNPGTSYTTSMPFCIALAVREMRMSPSEALWAATAGGARALRSRDVGRLSPGARANFAVLDAPSYVHLAYRPGVPLVLRTWKDGERVWPTFE
jgi:imidazolonepropionase